MDFVAILILTGKYSKINRSTGLCRMWNPVLFSTGY